MNLFNVFVGIISLALALLGIVLTVRANRRKLVTYDISGPISLISILPDAAGRRLTILYEKTIGTEPVKIKNAYLHYIRIANLGKESVRREDLAPDDPLRIQIHGGNVLELATAGITRPMLGFTLSPLKEIGDTSTSNISFDFLDYKDGAVVKLLTDDPRTEVTVRGTIIGMSSGIRAGTRPRVGKHVRFLSVLAIGALWISLGFILVHYFFQPNFEPANVEQPSWFAAFFITLILLLGCIGPALLWMRYFHPFPDDGWPKSMKLPVNYSPLGLLTSHQVRTGEADSAATNGPTPSPSI